MVKSLGRLYTAATAVNDATPPIEEGKRKEDGKVSL